MLLNFGRIVQWETLTGKLGRTHHQNRRLGNTKPCSLSCKLFIINWNLVVGITHVYLGRNWRSEINQLWWSSCKSAAWWTMSFQRCRLTLVKASCSMESSTNGRWGASASQSANQFKTVHFWVLMLKVWKMMWFENFASLNPRVWEMGSLRISGVDVIKNICFWRTMDLWCGILKPRHNWALDPQVGFLHLFNHFCCFSQFWILALGLKPGFPN